TPANRYSGCARLRNSFNNTPPERGAPLFAFLPFIKSPAFAPFCPFSGDSSVSVCFCSPLLRCSFAFFRDDYGGKNFAGHRAAALSKGDCSFGKRNLFRCRRNRRRALKDRLREAT